VNVAANKYQKKSRLLKDTWWVKTILSSLTAGMFAAIVAIIFVILHTIHFQPVRYLEQFGIDEGMQLYLNTASLPISYQYAFVDVDQEACKRFLDDKTDWDSECVTSKPIPSSLIVDFVRAARESKAALVIVDVSPPEKHEKSEREALARELGTHSTDSKTWIIAPVYARPSNSINGLTFAGDFQFDLVPNHSQGNLRLASAATYAENGTIRAYPTASCIKILNTQRWIPTIPYLAAVLLKNPTLQDKYYDSDDYLKTVEAGQMNDCGLQKITSNHFSTDKRIELFSFDPLAIEKIPAIVHFFYSLPSLSNILDEDEREIASWKHVFNYQHYQANKLIDLNCSHKFIDDVATKPACFVTNEEYYKDKIIVLGSSRAQSFDQVHTPVGQMAGGELLLNATRAFLEFEPIRQLTPITMLKEKFIGIGIAMIPMTITWGLIFLSGDWALKMRRNLIIGLRKTRWKIVKDFHWRIINIFRSIFVGIIFAVGIYTAYLLEVIYLFDQIKQGVATDLLLPAIALGLQGFAVAAKVISAFFYKLAEILFEFISNRLT